jgi:hypothetical protein
VSTRIHRENRDEKRRMNVEAVSRKGVWCPYGCPNHSVGQRDEDGEVKAKGNGWM